MTFESALRPGRAPRYVARAPAGAAPPHARRAPQRRRAPEAQQIPSPRRSPAPRARRRARAARRARARRLRRGERARSARFSTSSSSGRPGAARSTPVESRPDLVAGAATRAAPSRPGSLPLRHGPHRRRRLARAPASRDGVARVRHGDRRRPGHRDRARRGPRPPSSCRCCQAEVARQLAATSDREPADEALIRHALHRRELGSHLTNVVRGLCLAAHGYKVTVTELVGWEHSAKNELVLGARVHRFHAESRATLARLLERWRVEPALVRLLRTRGLDPCAPAS